MKYLITITALIVLLAAPVFAQFWINVGSDVPIAVVALSGGEITTESEITTFFPTHILPLTEVGLYYQFGLGPVKLAPGVHIYTLVLENLLWPNLLAEFQLGPVFIDAQVGGGLFGLFGLYNDFQMGNVFLPDLSVWFGFGKNKNFRVGAGCFSIMHPEITMEGMLIIPYAGFNASLLIE